MISCFFAHFQHNLSMVEAQLKDKNSVECEVGVTSTL